MKKLPFELDLNTVESLILLSEANNKIGELKGTLSQLPNPDILLSAITLGEAKASSEIENIITTYDELYKEKKNGNQFSSAKEVLKYRQAINEGYDKINRNGFISTNIIKDIHSSLDSGKTGIRKMPGTVIKNERTNEIIYTPPQSEEEILYFLTNLENYLNDTNEYDPLIEMAILHFQFESIHPFYDGNGRTGRILNILYLVLKNKIDHPVLYLSKYIINTKDEYYDLLKLCNQDINNIHLFIQYMLKGISETSVFTINFINDVVVEMSKVSEVLQKKTKLYSWELVEFLFSDFYLTISEYSEEFRVSRQTASNHLKILEQEGLLYSEKEGNNLLFKNASLISIMERW